MDREKVIGVLINGRVKAGRMGLNAFYIDFGIIDEIITLLKEQEHKDKMYHALEEDWKALLKEQEAVVRCKDCKYYHKPEYGFTYGDCTYCSAWQQVNTDDFCSKGKRKDT